MIYNPGQTVTINSWPLVESGVVESQGIYWSLETSGSGIFTAAGTAPAGWWYGRIISGSVGNANLVLEVDIPADLAMAGNVGRVFLSHVGNDATKYTAAFDVRPASLKDARLAFSSSLDRRGRLWRVKQVLQPSITAGMEIAVLDGGLSASQYEARSVLPEALHDTRISTYDGIEVWLYGRKAPGLLEKTPLTIWRSTDGARSWEEMPSDIPLPVVSTPAQQVNGFNGPTLQGFSLIQDLGIVRGPFGTYTPQGAASNVRQRFSWDGAAMRNVARFPDIYGGFFGTFTIDHRINSQFLAEAYSTTGARFTRSTVRYPDGVFRDSVTIARPTSPYSEEFFPRPTPPNSGYLIKLFFQEGINRLHFTDGVASWHISDDYARTWSAL